MQRCKVSPAFCEEWTPIGTGEESPKGRRGFLTSMSEDVPVLHSPSMTRTQCAPERTALSFEDGFGAAGRRLSECRTEVRGSLCVAVGVIFVGWRGIKNTRGGECFCPLPEYYKGLRNQHRMGKFAFGLALFWQRRCKLCGEEIALFDYNVKRHV